MMNGLARIALVAFVLLIAGCGDGGPPLAVVEGTVTVDDKPVVMATLTFVPENGSPSYGQTDKDGKYSLMFTDTKYGAMLGNHTVSIEGAKLSKGEIEELKAQGADVPSADVAIPRQYLKPGALIAVVERGKNTIDFKLKSK